MGFCPRHTVNEKGWAECGQAGSGVKIVKPDDRRLPLNQRARGAIPKVRSQKYYGNIKTYAFWRTWSAGVSKLPMSKS